MYFVWQQMLKLLFPSKQKMSDVGSLLYGVVAWQAWRTIAKIYVLAIVVGLFLARMYIAPAPAASDAGPDMIVAGLLLLPFVAATLMLHGFPTLFSRLWIFGASENRSQTAMIILLLVASRSLIFSMLLLPFLLSLGVFSSLGFASTLLIAVVLIGVGTVPVLIIAKCYPFLVKHESFTVVAMLATGGAAMIFAISNSRLMVEKASELIATVGSIPCLLIAFIATSAGRCVDHCRPALRAGSGPGNYVFHQTQLRYSCTSQSARHQFGELSDTGREHL
jgi:MFS family permease